MMHVLRRKLMQRTILMTFFELKTNIQIFKHLRFIVAFSFYTLYLIS